MRPLAFAAAFAALLLAAPAALADVAPPNTSGCVNQPIGGMCKLDDGTMGTCAAMTCGRPLPDGGSTSYACNVCQRADGGTAAGSDAGGSDGGASGTSSSSSSGGCSVTTGARGAGALAIVGIALGAAALAGRTRKRR